MLRQTLRLALSASTGLALLAGTAAAEDIVIRFQHNETEPPTMASYQRAIEAFEAENPGVKIEMETIATDGRIQKIAAAINAKTVPDVFKLLPEEREQFAERGYLAPLDSIVDSIGEADFADGLIHRVDGHVYDVPYTIGNYGIFWYRTDLLEAAGLEPPTDWEELLAAAKTLNVDGNSGFILPAGQNRMTSLFLAEMMWSAGSTFFDADLNVSFDNPGTVQALTAIRDLAAYSPSGIATYSYSDMTDVYLTGKVAMDFFAPRLIARAYRDTPEIAAKTGVAPMPVGPAGVGAKGLSPNVFALASEQVGGDNVEMAKKFLEFLLTGERMKDFSLTVYPHLIPPLKSLQAEVAEAGNQLGMDGRATELGLVSYDLSNAMTFENEAGAKIEDGKIVLSGAFNPYIGPIIARNIPAVVVQKVVLEGIDPAEAATWGAEQMEAVVADMKAAEAK